MIKILSGIFKGNSVSVSGNSQSIIQTSGEVIVNGIRISNPDNLSVSVSSKGVYLGGKLVEVEGFADAKIINITVNGNVDSLQSQSCGEISITGSAGNIESENGSIVVQGDVSQNVSTSNGKIKVGGNVTGNVSTSDGNIKIDGTVGGSVKTSNGNITHKK